MAFFGLTVQPNLLADTQLPAPLSVTNAALPHALREPSAKAGRSTVSVSIEDGEFIPICTLIPGVVEQHKLDLVFEEGSTLRLKVEGGNPVALSGYFQNEDEGLSEMDEEDLLRLAAMREAEENEDSEDDEEDEDEEDESMEVDGDSDDDEEEVDSAALEAAVKRQVAEKAAAKVKADAEKSKKAAAAAAAEAEKAKKAAAAEKKRKADSPAEDAPEPAAKKAKAAAAEPLPKPVTLKGGLVIQDLTPADPTAPRAKAGQRIGMRYIGKLKNGKIFDQNTKGQPFSFKLGKGEVISGWDAGIPGMAVGQRRQLTIPAKMAYGKRGAPPEIPPNSDLIFEVKLLQIYK